MYAQQQYNM
jgi:hypothetical protein